MSDADIEVLPGFNRADLTYLAECLEGVHGDGRRTDAETLEKAAKFVRAALAVTPSSVQKLTVSGHYAPPPKGVTIEVSGSGSGVGGPTEAKSA